jgi:Ca2+-binding EF-hand superfamily protein
MSCVTDTSQLPLIHEFHRMDADGDGVVDRTDYLRAPREILTKLGVPEDSPNGQAFLDASHVQWEALLALADTDRDNVLSLDEYLNRRVSADFRSPDRPGKGDVSRALFTLLDTDGDGTISVSEFVHAAGFLCMPDQDALDYFEQQDSDDDGRLDLDEFLGAIKLFYSAPE